MTPLQQLQSKIQEVIHPNGIPLEFTHKSSDEWNNGCGNKPFFCNIIDKRKRKDDCHRVLRSGVKTPGVYHKDFIIQNTGKPIDLQDILLALVSKDVQIKLFKEQIQIAKFYGFQKKPLIIDIDLTKTIAEQDEETIKALLELIS